MVRYIDTSKVKRTLEVYAYVLKETDLNITFPDSMLSEVDNPDNTRLSDRHALSPYLGDRRQRR